MKQTITSILMVTTLLFAGAAIAEDEAGGITEKSFFGQLDLTRKELDEVREAVEKEDWKTAKAAWCKHLKERTSPNWYWRDSDRAKIIRFLEMTDDKFTEKAGEAANKVLKREFSWQNQPAKTDHRIDFTKNYGRTATDFLNRHPFLVKLGRAYFYTGDETYAKDWAFIIRSFAEDNPYRGKQWKTWHVMNAPSRILPWIESLYLVRKSPAFDAETAYLYSRSLLEHGRYTVARFRREKKLGAQIWGPEGLSALGIMFPEFKESKEWREHSHRLLQRITDSVAPDGSTTEYTPGYHYWTTKEFVRAQFLAQKNGYKIEGLAELHQKMFEFLMQVSKPDRWFVPIGDAGHGKDISEIMGLGALVYNRPDMRYLAVDSPHPSWIWLFSMDELAGYADIPKQKPTLGSHMMPNTKIGVMRTGWEKDDRFLLFDCAPWGGGHSHKDQLQVVLYSGRDLLVDSGQGDYGSKLAGGYYKQAKAHNVLLFDGQRVNGRNPTVLSWNVEDRVEFVSGSLGGWQRSVLFVKPSYWVVVDHVTGEGEHKLTRLFHLPDVNVTHEGKTVRTHYEDGDNIWIGGADEGVIEMREGYWRKSADETPQPPVAAFVSTQSLPAALCTVLVPFGKEGEIPTITRLSEQTSGQVSLRLDFKDGRTDWIAIAREPSELSAGPYNGKGIALCVRKNKDKESTDILQVSPIE